MSPIELAELQDAGIDWSLLGFDADELARLPALDTAGVLDAAHPAQPRRRFATRATSRCAPCQGRGL